MNKKLYLMLIAVFLLFPLRSYALENATISCNKTKLSKNEETTCQIITGNLGYEIASFQGKISLGSNLTLTSSSYDSSKWMFFGTNFSVTDIELATKNSYLLANNLHIATFKIKASNSASGTSSISLTNINVSDKNYSAKTLSCNPINISFSSSVNTLNSLSVKEQQINFNKDTTTYSFTTNSDSITISATPTDSSATVSGTGKINLNYGSNQIKIVVTAEDGSKREYTLNVTRSDNRSSNNNLKKLSLSDGKISFAENKTAYTVDVDSKVETITISAELADSKASFVQGYGPRKVDLNYGANKVLIKIKSENGQEKTYTITVNRKDDRSNNNFLKEIKLSAGKIKFNKDKTEYKVSVPYETQNFEIKAKADDEKSKIEIVGEKELQLGENIFTIKVTAENEEVKEYKIIVTREEKIEITYSNKLKNIEIEGHKIDFNPNEYYYIVKTNNSKLNIKVTLQDKNSTYKINGNDNLKDGSVISIIVTDKDGNSNVYKLMIVKQSSPIPYLLITFLLVLLSICITIFVMKKKKKDNNNKDQDSHNDSTDDYNSKKTFVSNNPESFNRNGLNEVDSKVDPIIMPSNDLNVISKNNVEQINNKVFDNEQNSNYYSNSNTSHNNYSSFTPTSNREEASRFDNSSEATSSNFENKKYCKNCNRVISSQTTICPWCRTIND